MTRESASVGPTNDSVAGAYQRDDPAPVLVAHQRTHPALVADPFGRDLEAELRARGIEPTLAAQPAPTLDRERLARALHESDMMRRYKDYADRLPTMRPSPVHDLCIEWAAAIADAYEAAPMLTLAQAAVRLGRSPSTLRNQVKAGRLRARLVGKTWTVSEHEVERYRAQSLGHPGRPRHLSGVAPCRPHRHTGGAASREQRGDAGTGRPLHGRQARGGLRRVAEPRLHPARAAGSPMKRLAFLLGFVIGAALLARRRQPIRDDEPDWYHAGLVG